MSLNDEYSRRSEPMNTRYGRDVSRRGMRAQIVNRYAFMLVEIVGDEMYFQAITDKGMTLDVGSIRRVGNVEPTRNVTAQPVVPQAKPSPRQPGPKGTSGTRR